MYVWYLRVVCLGALALVWSYIGGGALEGLVCFAVGASGEVHETLMGQ